MQRFRFFTNRFQSYFAFFLRHLPFLKSFAPVLLLPQEPQVRSFLSSGNRFVWGFWLPFQTLVFRKFFKQGLVELGLMPVEGLRTGHVVSFQKNRFDVGGSLVHIFLARLLSLIQVIFKSILLKNTTCVDLCLLPSPVFDVHLKLNSFANRFQYLL